MKYLATVCLPPTGQDSAADALVAALAPFDLNNDRDEPADIWAAWDWWAVPTHGALPLKPEHRGDPRVAWAELPDGNLVVLAAPKAAIDFATMRREAAEHAAGTWDAWAAVASAHPPALPRAHFDATCDPADAQRLYLLQPAIQEVALAAATQQHPYFTFPVLLADPVAQFSGDRDAFVARAAAVAFATYAYITLDGAWVTQFTDDRGWDAHVLAMTDYLDALPDDTVLAVVKCHI
ncbi:hypothetical protein GCM10009682_45080 [Luedemannella flava]|uniref:Uncharacterized protein n=1 Tax=Luedemannella flava TaxID=349316 RepID=A0ABN2MCK8_9ACTN